jgi:hypothetical protein
VKPGLAWLFLVTGLVLTAGRALIAARESLRVEPGAFRYGRPHVPDSLFASASLGDSMLSAMAVPDRDPFGAPKPRQTDRPRWPAKEAAALVRPRVVLLMQDGSSTLVQLEVESRTSGWMSVGSAFQGWTIEAITSDGVTVSNGKTRLTLPKP